MLRSACSVCATMPSAISPLAGSIPAVPETKTNPLATIAWLYGPSAEGESGVETAVLVTGGLSERGSDLTVDLVAGDLYEQAPLVAESMSGDAHLVRAARRGDEHGTLGTTTQTCSGQRNATSSATPMPSAPRSFASSSLNNFAYLKSKLSASFFRSSAESRK